MKRIIILTTMMLAYSCVSNNKEITQEKNVPYAPIDKSLLNGVWGDKPGENALFFIQNDSIYYIEQQDHPYPIALVRDTLLIYFDDTVFPAKILKLDRDSLILQSGFGTSRLYRRKE